MRSQLKIETALTIDLDLRRAKGPLRFEATTFYNKFKNFIYWRSAGMMCGNDINSCGVDAEIIKAAYSRRRIPEPARRL